MVIVEEVDSLTKRMIGLTFWRNNNKDDMVTQSHTYSLRSAILLYCANTKTTPLEYYKELELKYKLSKEKEVDCFSCDDSIEEQEKCTSFYNIPSIRKGCMYKSVVAEDLRNYLSSHPKDTTRINFPKQLLGYMKR